MEKLQNSIVSAYDNIPNSVKLPLIAIGAAWVAKNVYGSAKAAYRHFLRSPRDLQGRYGKQSWAIVTGAGQGIGEQWAIQLAQKQFNIVCVGRGQNVDDLAQKLQKDYKVQAISVKTDLNKTEDGVRDIKLAVQDLDVSILVNNAGVSIPCLIEMMQWSHIERQININCITPTRLIQELVPGMKNRQQRSAIINISSVAAIQCPGYAAIYAATKGYMNAFSQSLAAELEEKIDVLTVSPAMVSTKMTQKPKAQGFTITPEQCVAGALKELGRENFTYGGWRHALQFSLFSIEQNHRMGTAAFKPFAYKVAGVELSQQNDELKNEPQS